MKCSNISNYQNLLITNKNNFTKSIATNDKNWITVNQPDYQKLLRVKSKKLVIYPYSLSNNLLKEVLIKMGVNFTLTDDVRKASLILGLKKHLKQNFKLNNLAKQINIPIYTLNQVSFYQVTKFIQFIRL